MFDEFVEQHEFELALHVVCDLILDSVSPQPSKSILDQIRDLHTAVRIDDSCVQKLQGDIPAGCTEILPVLAQLE